MKTVINLHSNLAHFYPYFSNEFEMVFISMQTFIGSILWNFLTGIREYIHFNRISETTK